MAGDQMSLVNTPIDFGAQNHATEKVREFGASLLLESKLCANRDRSGIVLAKHIDEAFETIQTGRSRPKRELLMVLGGAFFGAFVQGFVTELAESPLRPLLITVYTVLGFVGMFLILWDLRR